MKNYWIRSGCAAEGGARKTQRDTVRHRETRTGTQRDTGDEMKHNLKSSHIVIGLWLDRGWIEVGLWLDRGWIAAEIAARAQFCTSGPTLHIFA